MDWALPKNPKVSIKSNVTIHFIGIEIYLVKIHFYTKIISIDRKISKILQQIIQGFISAKTIIPLIINTTIKVMDKHIVLDFFTRSQRSILGVCSAFSKAFNLPVIGIRICLIVLSLIFIPLGVITYIGGYLIFNQKRGRTVAFALVGA